MPAIDITNVGFAFKDATEAAHATDGPLGDYLHREFAAKGLYMMREWWDSGMRQITTSNHPVRVPEDMNNLKIRIAVSKIGVDFFKSLGAVPAPLDSAAMYTSLQTKLVDGNELPAFNVEASRTFEVQKYLSLTNHSWSGLALVIHGETWNGLAPDLQAIIERNNRKYTKLERRDTMLLDSAVTNKLARQGLAVNRIDPAVFRVRLKGYYTTWAATFGSSAWSALQSSISSRLSG